MSQSNKTQQSSSPKNPPFWKASLIKALRGTIGVLETTAINLETETPPGSEEKPGFLQKLQQLWSGILGKIRLILPAKFSAKLTDTALTGIIGGVVVMVFLITSNVFGSKPTQIATVPPDTEMIPVVDTTKTKSIAPEAEKVSLSPTEETILNPEVEIPPVIEQKTDSPEEITVSLSPTEETILNPEVEIPPVIEQKTDSPEEITVSLSPTEETTTNPEVEIPTVIEQKTDSPEEITFSLPPTEETPPQEELETTPAPTLLTPEEALIAAIQNQIADISITPKGSNSANSTFSGIVESIQANFLDSDLTIKISPDWYNLEKSQQDKLAAEILQRSQELDFLHLEITDLKGKLIARNPVIGTDIVIFKRRNGA